MFHLLCSGELNKLYDGLPKEALVEKVLDSNPFQKLNICEFAIKLHAELEKGIQSTYQDFLCLAFGIKRRTF
jgi:hypothetical protein